MLAAQCQAFAAPVMVFGSDVRQQVDDSSYVAACQNSFCFKVFPANKVSVLEPCPSCGEKVKIDVRRGRASSPE